MVQQLVRLIVAEAPVELAGPTPGQNASSPPGLHHLGSCQRYPTSSLYGSAWAGSAAWNCCPSPGHWSSPRSPAHVLDKSFRRRCALHGVRRLLVQLIDVRQHDRPTVVARTVASWCMSQRLQHYQFLLPSQRFITMFCMRPSPSSCWLASNFNALNQISAKALRYCMRSEDLGLVNTFACLHLAIPRPSSRPSCRSVLMTDLAPGRRVFG